MPFEKEPTEYEKTILSDLQGAWQLLREAVVATNVFDGFQRVLLHIDEAMSWEMVRNLDKMPPIVLIIRNICMQSGVEKEILDCIDDIDDILKEVLEEYAK